MKRLLAALVLLAGCATGPNADPRDPLEPMNRGVSTFNRGVDKALLKPAAAAYHKVLPGAVRTGVSNFFGNLGDAWSVANSVLQLKVADAAHGVIRFCTNTFFGLGGVVDFATEFGIERHKEDFGTTLAHWGVPPGPYVLLPVLGPSTLRDTVALPVDWLADPVASVTPVTDRNALLIARGVHIRAKLLPLEPILDIALDPYVMTRDAYLQYRQSQISRDTPPAQELTDPR